MARSPLRKRIVAVSAFYAMYVTIHWWMMCSYRLCCSVESRTLHTKYLMSYHNRRKAIDLGEVDDVIPETQRSSSVDDFDCVEKAVQGACRSEGSTSVTSKRKRCKIMDEDEIYRESCKEMKEALVRFGEMVVECLNKESLEAHEIYKKVSDELKALPGITVTKRFKAAHFIGKDVVLGRSSLGLTQEEKIDMVESYNCLWLKYCSWLHYG